MRHYLQAVKDTDSDDGLTVMARMKDVPVSDAYTTNGRIRKDQRMVHDLYLVQVKAPAESKGPWDLLKLVATIPPDQAFRPLNRFSLGTKNKSLKFNPDGSLTLFFQNESPGTDEESNWVPAPKDEFSLYIRAYWPKAEILDGSWQPPLVNRIN